MSKRLKEMASGLEVSRINHEDIIMAIAFSPDGSYLATAGLDATARVWEVNSGLEVSCINHEDIIVAIAFSPDGRYLATASEDSTAQIWEADTRRRVACLTHADSVNNIAFSPGGEYLVTVTGSKVFPGSVYTTSTATVWEVTTGRPIMYITPGYAVKAFTFSPNGKYLAIASSDHAVDVWSEAIISRKFVELAHEYEVKSDIAFDSNSRHLATVMHDPSAWVWKLNPSLVVARMIHDHPIQAITFSPDGQHLATASLDGTARVWEVNSGREIARMTHEQEINAVAFSPDGKHLATASDDHTARVWEVTNAQEITRLTFKDKVNAVAFSSNGKLLATASGDLMSGGEDHNACLWLWQPKELIANLANDINNDA